MAWVKVVFIKCIMGRISYYMNCIRMGIKDTFGTSPITGNFMSYNGIHLKKQFHLWAHKMLCLRMKCKKLSCIKALEFLCGSSGAREPQ